MSILTPYQVDSKLKAIDDALHLLNQDIKPFLQAFNSALHWGGPRGSDDFSPEARQKWIRVYLDKFNANVKELGPTVRKARAFAGRYPQWPDIAGLMNLDHPENNQDFYRYANNLEIFLRQYSQREPMDTLGQLTEGDRELCRMRLGAAELLVAQAAAKLVEIRTQTAK